MSQFYHIGGVFPSCHWSSLVVIGCHWQSLAVIGFQTYPFGYAVPLAKLHLVKFIKDKGVQSGSESSHFVI